MSQLISSTWQLDINSWVIEMVESIALRRLERLREEERQRLIGAGVNELLTELVRQLRIVSNDPEYWEIIVDDVDTPTLLLANNKFSIVNVDERGKLVAASITITDKNALLEYELDDMTIRTTPSILYQDGLLGYNPGYPWLSRYDDSNNEYVIWFTPVPDRHYFTKIRIEVTPTTNATITYSCYRYRFREERILKR